MAGSKTNTITYVFEGDTLNLEQAIKRVQSLMRGTVKTLKEQEGGMTEVQKSQYKQLRSLMKTIKELQEKSVLGDADKKRLNNAMKKALQISNSLYKSSLREKDKIRRKELAREKKDVQKAQDEAAELEFARTPEAQVRAHSQLQQLSRLKGFMNPSDPAEKEALTNLDAVITEYNQAKQAYDAGYGSMERLAAATTALNNKYQELAGSLNRLSSEQNKANHGEGKSTFLQFLLGKAKSLTVYKLIKAVLAKIAQMISKAFQKMALISNTFNDAISRMTSSFQLIADKIATMLGPLIQMITPFLEYIAKAIGVITDKINQMFNAIAGNDAWIQARYQVEDYAEAIRKANRTQGIDELNKLDTQQNNMVEVKIEGMENLKAVGKILSSVLGIIQSVLDPLVNTLAPVLGLIAELIGSIFVALNPLFQLISKVVQFISGAIGSVLLFLINNVLAPVVNWLGYIISHLELLIPLAVALLAIWAAFNWSSFIQSLILVGVKFELIAKSIWGAIKAAVAWVVQGVKTIAMNIRNAVSAWIAEKAYWKLAIAAIAAAGVAAIAVLGIVGAATAGASSMAASNQGSDPSVAALAVGGIVAAPTLALVGEGKYPEAVVPLGQSPQFQSMKEGIAQEVVGALGIQERNAGSANSGRPVVLNIDGRTLAKALWPNLVETQYQVGVKLK